MKDYADLPPVPAYGGELNQVWTNLLDNAIYAAPEGSTLTVQTRLDTHGNAACVEVIDHGPGILEEVQHRIFEPFFTTKGVGEGTGLGLDIAHRIVTKRHLGTLRVSSKPGETRFEVRFALRTSRRRRLMTNPAKKSRSHALRHRLVRGRAGLTHLPNAAKS